MDDLQVVDPLVLGAEMKLDVLGEEVQLSVLALKRAFQGVAILVSVRLDTLQEVHLQVPWNQILDQDHAIHFQCWEPSSEAVTKASRVGTAEVSLEVSQSSVDRNEKKPATAPASSRHSIALRSLDHVDVDVA
jgi:hypothetical protein